MQCNSASVGMARAHRRWGSMKKSGGGRAMHADSLALGVICTVDTRRGGLIGMGPLMRRNEIKKKKRQ